MKLSLETKSLQIMFVTLTIIIFFISFIIFSYSGNLFQFYINKHNLSPHLFPVLNSLALLIMTTIMLLCVLEKFQQTNYQLVLISSLMLTLVLVPVTLTTYPIVSGFSNAIFNLTEPWRQLYVPPAIRATVEGVTEGILGFIDVRSVTVESFWTVETGRFRFVTIALSLCAIFFWWLANALKHTALEEETEQKPESISNLLKKYPFIFILCFVAGANEGLFNYTYFLGKEILSSSAIPTYQYIIYISSIFSPILMGRIADKFGIFAVVMISSILLIACKLLNATCASLHVTTPMYYFIIVFFEAGLTVGIWILSTSLVGERLRTKGIFRSFALSNIAFGAGTLVCANIYSYYSNSFAQTKLSIAILDIVSISAVWYFYRRAEKNGHLTPTT